MSQQLESDEVQRSAARQHETFGQEFFCVFTRSCYQCQNFTHKHLIVVIEMVVASICWDVDCLPYHNFLKMLDFNRIP